MEIDEDSQVTAQIQARFEKATIANEILDILDHADSFRILVSNAKAPFVRKSIIHLSSFAESESAAEYSRALCALAMLWSEKLLRPIVDQLTKRFLTLRMSDCYDALTLDQKVLVANWVASKNFPWLREHALIRAIRDSNNSNLCQIHVKTLFDKSTDAASVLDGLSNAVKDRRTTLLAREGEALPSIPTLLSVVCNLLLRVEKPLGKHFPDALWAFVSLAFDVLQEASTAGELSSFEYELATTICTVVERTPCLLASESIAALLAQLENRLTSRPDKRWVKVRARFQIVATEAIKLLASLGCKGLNIVEALKALGFSHSEIQSMLQGIVDAIEIDDTEIVQWLSNNRIHGTTKSQAQKSECSDDELVAAIMVRAEELTRANQRNVATSDEDLISPLLTEIEQLAVVRAMNLDGEVGQIIAYNPVRQSLTEPIGSETNVLVLAPGVIKTQSEGRFHQVRRSIVEPAKHKVESEASARI